MLSCHEQTDTSIVNTNFASIKAATLNVESYIDDDCQKDILLCF